MSSNIEMNKLQHENEQLRVSANRVEHANLILRGRVVDLERNLRHAEQRLKKIEAGRLRREREVLEFHSSRLPVWSILGIHVNGVPYIMGLFGSHEAALQHLRNNVSSEITYDKNEKVYVDDVNLYWIDIYRATPSMENDVKKLLENRT